MSSRLHHIDALRSFAMLFGLLVHTGSLEANAVSWIVGTVSEHFRMATFFVVSGFFAGMVASRRGNRAFVRARAEALLVPFFAALILLNPVTNWLVYLWHSGHVGLIDYLVGERPHSVVGPEVWHLHLWFLVSLFVYVTTLPLVRPLMLISWAQAVLALLARLGSWCVPLLAFVAISSEIGMRVVWQLTLAAPLEGTPAGWLPFVTMIYWVYFLMGLAAFAHRPLFEAMHRISLPTFAAGAGLYVLTAALPAEVPEVMRRMIQIAAEEAITVAAVCSLLFLFRRFLGAERKWVMNLSASVYSIYLFHYALIYLIALALRPFVENIFVLFFVVPLLAGALGYKLHTGLIARIPLLTWLFNGKRKLAGQPRPAA